VNRYEYQGTRDANHRSGFIVIGAFETQLRPRIFYGARNPDWDTVITDSKSTL
jgi:hypothetical protein